MNYTSKFKSLTAPELYKLVGGQERLKVTFEYIQFTWISNNKGVSSLKSDIAGYLTTSELLSLNLIK